MAISPARIAVFDILLRVETEDAYASELLHSARLDPLSPPDRALATEIVMGTLRWQGWLDHQIASASERGAAKLDAEVRIALRMAAYQIALLDRVPDRAAVHESVELVKRARKRSAAPFVNAVLRRVVERRTLPPKLDQHPLSDDEKIELIALGASHPLWMVRRWAASFGIPSAARIAAAGLVSHSPALRVPDTALDAELGAEGIELRAGHLLTSARRVLAGDVTKTRAFREGRVHIQDEASQLVALLVGHGARILDCCAAPGGKTAVLAERNPEAKIVAAEIHPQRAALTRERVRAANVEVLTSDATRLPTSGGFDRVLADVPCSGTGTLAQHPEIKWRLKPEKLAEFHQLQVRILGAALAQLAPGGKLVYSTCSLEREEDEDVVEEALRARSEVALLDMRDELAALSREGELAEKDLESLLAGKCLRTLPGVHPCDGFFAAVLRRV